MLDIKRKTPWIGVALSFGLGLVVAGPSSAQDAAVKITLRAADSLPTTHIFSVGFQNWMKRVTDLTNGQMQFQFFPSEQLAKRKDLFDLARDGTIDITYVVPVDHPAQLARSTVVELPGFATLSACGTAVLQKVIHEYQQDEYIANGVRPLFELYVGGYEIFSNKDVHVPADLKGMKIRSAGGSQDVTLKSLGAVPVTLASPEVYQAVERGTIDGVLFPWTGVPAYKLDEVTHNATYGAALGATGLTYVINEKVYEGLPQNVKDAMAQATEEVTPTTVGAQDKTLTDLVAKLRASGMKIIDFTQADRAMWRQSLADVEATWIQTAASNGVKDPKSIIEKRDQFAAATPACN